METGLILFSPGKVPSEGHPRLPGVPRAPECSGTLVSGLVLRVTFGLWGFSLLPLHLHFALWIQKRISNVSHSLWVLCISLVFQSICPEILSGMEIKDFISFSVCNSQHLPRNFFLLAAVWEIQCPGKSGNGSLQTELSLSLEDGVYWGPASSLEVSKSRIFTGNLRAKFMRLKQKSGEKSVDVC